MLTNGARRRPCSSAAEACQTRTISSSRCHQRSHSMCGEHQTTGQLRLNSTLSSSNTCSTRICPAESKLNERRSKHDNRSLLDVGSVGTRSGRAGPKASAAKRRSALSLSVCASIAEKVLIAWQIFTCRALLIDCRHHGAGAEEEELGARVAAGGEKHLRMLGSYRADMARRW